MIKKIKDNISSNLYCNVRVVYNGSRNRKEEYFGIVKEVYDNIFIIELKTGEVKSFSYSDVLTDTVELFFDKI